MSPTTADLRALVQALLQKVERMIVAERYRTALLLISSLSLSAEEQVRVAQAVLEEND
jgi:hypothetical protein